MMLQVEEEDPVEQDTDPPDAQDKPEAETQQEHHLSLNAMKGGCGIGTIRFSGRIGNTPIQILLDGGSSESFLQPRIAHFLKLPVAPKPSFRVLIGNGQTMQTEGWVEQLNISVQNQELRIPVYLLPLVGADLILGSAWLATLGLHFADYASATIKFIHQGKFITLQGERELQTSQAHLHQLRRMQSTDAISELFAVQLLPQTVPEDELCDLPTDIEPELATLLHTYRVVFSTPVGLPPSRSHNHAIPLLEGSKPVKVRPYRYPHSQKEQIEVMV